MESQPFANSSGPNPAVRALLSHEIACGAIFELSPVGLLQWDQAGAILTVNPAMLALVQRPATDILGRALPDLIHPDDWKIVQALMSSSPAEQVCNLRFWNQEGRYVRVAMKVCRLPADGQGATSWLGMTQAFTGETASAALSHVQNAALEAIGNAVLVTNELGEVVYVNRAFTELSGYSATEMLGKNPRLLKSGRHEPVFYRQIWSTISAGRPWQGEIVNRRKDGSFYTQEQWINPVRDGSGRITHYIAIQQDITQRKRLETELRQSRERFLKVFHANPMAIGICSQASRLFLDVNESFLKLLGYSREEVIGKSASALDLWAQKSQHDRLVAELHKYRAVNNLEIQLKTKTGKLVDVLTSVETIQLGLEACWLFIDVDITARKMLETQLRQTAKMEAMGTLAGGVAHDFNNLLTVIRGHLEMLAANSELGEDSLESVQQISEAADRAAHLTRQLLTFSRKQPFQPKPLDLNDVLVQCSKMLRRIIGEDINLELTPGGGLPPVLADAGMIEQIIFNLAANARDAMPNGGRLLISTDYPLRPGMKTAGRPAHPTGYARITVQDTGCGIPLEIQGRIFEPFFTTKGVGHGTGLGLATVKSIIEQHGGWIELSSQPEAGTSFLFYLPTASHYPTAQSASGMAAVQAPKGTATILLVEDEEAVRHLAVDILRIYGYQVIAAATGPEAIMLWGQHKDQINLVLTDMVMPGGLSGMALAQRLREDRPDLKVLFSSGYVNPKGLLEDSMPPDRQHFLQKPYTPSQLAQAIHDVLNEGSPKGS